MNSSYATIKIQRCIECNGDNMRTKAKITNQSKEEKGLHNEELLSLANAEVNKALYDACAEDSVEKILSSIKNGADVNAKDGNGITPLHRAISKKQITVAEILIKNSADVNASDKDGKSALHRAAHNGSIALAKLLIKKGADVNARDKEGKSPLHRAVYKDHIELAELLIRKGADVNAQDNSKCTPLYLACSANPNPEIIKLLLQANHNTSTKCDVNILPRGVKTLMELFPTTKELRSSDSKAYYNNIAMKKLLRDAGCEEMRLSTRQSEQETIMQARQSAWRETRNAINAITDIIRPAMEMTTWALKFSLSNVFGDGSFPSYTAHRNNKAALRVKYRIRELLPQVNDLNGSLSNQDFKEARNICRGFSNRDVEALFAYNTSTYEGLRKVLADNQSADCLEILLKSNPKASAPGLIDILKRAIFAGQTDIAKLLIKKGVQVHNLQRTKEDGMSSDHDVPVIQYAISKGYTDIAKLLIEKGMPEITQHTTDPSLLYVALSKNNKEIVKSMIERRLKLINKDSLLGKRELNLNDLQDIHLT